MNIRRFFRIARNLLRPGFARSAFRTWRVNRRLRIAFDRTVRKAERDLRGYRIFTVEGWKWKNPAEGCGVDPFDANHCSPEYYYPFKDLTKVPHEEYFPGLLPEQALDRLAEKYYGNNER